MQFFWISGISSTFSPTAVLGSNHIERKEAANTLFFRKTSPTLPLPLIEHADVCLSPAGGPKICNLFLDLARFAITPTSRSFKWKWHCCQACWEFLPRCACSSTSKSRVPALHIATVPDPAHSIVLVTRSSRITPKLPRPNVLVKRTNRDPTHSNRWK